MTRDLGTCEGLDYRPGAREKTWTLGGGTGSRLYKLRGFDQPMGFVNPRRPRPLPTHARSPADCS